MNGTLLGCISLDKCREEVVLNGTTCTSRTTGDVASH